MDDWNFLEPVKGSIFAGMGAKKHPALILADTLYTQLELFNSGKESAAMFKVVGDKVRFVLKYGTTAVELPNGEKVAVIAKDKFADALEFIRQRVEEGKFDEKLEAIRKGYSDRKKGTVAGSDAT